MLHMPSEGVMERILENGDISIEAVRYVAEEVAAFHAKAETNKYINSFGELCSVRANTDENFAETESLIGRALNEEQYSRIKKYTESFLRSHGEMMHQRIDEGRIKDCRIDPHAAHMRFTRDGIGTYDCIESGERFRYVDVASEVAFLAMCLDKHQRPDLSAAFVDAYIGFSGDRTIARMLPFYKCYRAYVRGRVEGSILADAFIAETDKSVALENARKYFSLAFSYACRRPTLIIMAGIAGTRKSAVARTLSETLGATLISSDALRKRLAVIPETAHAYQAYQAFQDGIYSPWFSQKTYEALFDQAHQVLDSGETVILDAAFTRKEDRERARETAARHASRFLAVECGLPKEEAKRGTGNSTKEACLSDADWSLCLRPKSSFTHISELSETERVVIDPSGNWDKALSRIVEINE